MRGCERAPSRHHCRGLGTRLLLLHTPPPCPTVPTAASLCVHTAQPCASRWTSFGWQHNPDGLKWVPIAGSLSADASPVPCFYLQVGTSFEWQRDSKGSAAADAPAVDLAHLGEPRVLLMCVIVVGG